METNILNTETFHNTKKDEAYTVRCPWLLNLEDHYWMLIILFTVPVCNVYYQILGAS